MHGEAVEADLQRYYGIALSDLTTGKLTWRRLGVLIRQLPAGSATGRAQGGEATRWGDTEYLLALIADELAAGNWQRAVIAGAKPRPRPPKPLRRPGQQDTSTRLGKTSLSREQVKAFLRRFDPPTEPAAKEDPPDGN